MLFLLSLPLAALLFYFSIFLGFVLFNCVDAQTMLSRLASNRRNIIRHRSDGIPLGLRSRVVCYLNVAYVYIFQHIYCLRANISNHVNTCVDGRALNVAARQSDPPIRSGHEIRVPRVTNKYLHTNMQSTGSLLLNNRLGCGHIL